MNLHVVFTSNISCPYLSSDFFIVALGIFSTEVSDVLLPPWMEFSPASMAQASPYESILSWSRFEKQGRPSRGESIHSKLVFNFILNWTYTNRPIKGMRMRFFDEEVARARFRYQRMSVFISRMHNKGFNRHEWFYPQWNPNKIHSVRALHLNERCSSRFYYCTPSGRC